VTANPLKRLVKKLLARMGLPRLRRWINGQLRGLSIRATMWAFAVIAGVLLLGLFWAAAGATQAQSQALAAEHADAVVPGLAFAQYQEIGHNGQPSDPATASELTAVAAALRDGGQITLPGASSSEVVPAATDSALRRSVEQIDQSATELVQLAARYEGQAAPAAIRAQADQAMTTLNRASAQAGSRLASLATGERDRGLIEVVVLCVLILAIIGGWSNRFRRDVLGRLSSIAHSAQAVAGGDLSTRLPLDRRDEIGALAGALNKMTLNMARNVSRLEAGSKRDAQRNQLSDALDAADDIDQVNDVVGRAMGEILGSRRTELLLADSSQAHLIRVASSPGVEAPGCTVDTPFACTAVRRGTVSSWASSNALDACRKLPGRKDGPCSAVCVPVTFMGKPLGVLHSVGRDGQEASADTVSQLTSLASEAGTRIGTITAFKESQLQASTDGLTGLVNRRTLENRLRDMLSADVPFALAFADLDKFKQLNDTFGHEAGDRALRIFARTIAAGVRNEDIVARYGGEEFVLVFAHTDRAGASEVVDRLRVQLGAVLLADDAPPFTASFGLTDTTISKQVDELIRLADRGLMEAKAQGRNRLVLVPALGAQLGPEEPPAPPVVEHPPVILDDDSDR
jgi:diguanylate cyclase (GGDEF)-like protein